MLWIFISCEKTNLHSSAYLDSQQVWLIAAASRTGSIVHLSTMLVHHACQLSNVRPLGSLMTEDRWECLPRLQPALFDVSHLAPLSSSVQKSLVRLNQQQQRSLPLPHLLPSGKVNGVPAICSESFPERFTVHFCSIDLASCRVVFLHDELEAIRRQSSEDAAARAVKAKSCFCPFQMETFSIWGRQFGRFLRLHTENGQGSCSVALMLLKLLPQTFSFDFHGLTQKRPRLGNDLAAPTKTLRFYWTLKNESTFSAKFWFPRSKSLHPWTKLSSGIKI